VLVRDGAEVAAWPLERWRRPDIGDVDQLVRLQLSARRLGCSIRVRGACAELRALLDLSGLRDVVPADGEG
jgi:hypothetical protein